MLARAFHVAVSLVVVVGAFALYSLAVVPWIVPKQQDVELGKGPVADVNRRPIQIERLKPYFSAGDWELDEPIVVENPQFALLLRDYESLPGGRVKIQPCTLLFYPDGRPTDGAAGRVLVMRAPEGAELDFDEDCDLDRAKIGKLLGGRLLGEVSIRGNLSRTAAAGDSADEVAIVTRNVELRTDRIWSREDVQFRFGSNQGQGKEMLLLFDVDKQPAKQTAGPTMQAVKSFELKQDVRLFVDLDSDELFGSARQGGTVVAGSGESPPIEIQCQGPFRLDVATMEASFEDQVDVVRLNPDGPSDQLNCELLTIQFAERADTGALPPDAKPTSTIEATKITAQGNPVVVRSPGNGGYARGDRLELEIAARRLVLSGTDPVALKYDSSELSAERIDYAASSGEPGTLEAAGPGRLLTKLPSANSDTFEASWQGKLLIQPHEGRHVISLTGGSRLQYAETGALQAETIWLWLDKAAEQTSNHAASRNRGPGAAFAKLSPHSGLAITNVRLDAADMSATTDRLEVWFEKPGSNGTAASAVSTSGRSSGLPRSLGARGEQSDSHFHVSGRLIQVTIAIPDEGNPVPTNASVAGNVRLVERFAGPHIEPPLVVSGDHLDLFGADTAQTVVSITGSPAHAAARGMAITGAVLQLEKGTNRMWVNGAGGITLPIDRDLNGKPLAQADSMNINWQGKMLFDGQTIRFHRNVSARTTHQQLQTAELVVTLNRRLNFAERIEKDAIDLAGIDCRGGVLLDNHTVENGQSVSRDRIKTEDMSIDQRTGRLQAQGPGWITSVRKMSGDSPTAVLAGPSRTNPPTARPASRSAGDPNSNLIYAQILFQHGISGNTRDREIVFHDQIRCTYGPVQRWDSQITIDPAQGPVGDQVLMTCDQLAVRQMRADREGQRPVEMEALGNAHVQANTFAATGHRLTYTTGKELLVLEGTGQAFAQLTRQQPGGGAPSRAAAQKILYWRDANRVEIQGIRFGDGSWQDPR